MAKKQSGNSLDPVRAKAKAMRDAQQKADKRNRNIVISTVAVIIVAIIAALVIVVASQNSSSKESAQSSQSGQSIAVDGKPIIISPKGVGVKDASLPDLTLYYSYTCHWCTYLETAVGQKLVDEADAGKYNLVLQPVSTATMAWQAPATAAALMVAADEPDKFVAFHQAMMEYFNEAYAAQDGSVINDANASIKEVKEIAKEVGVSQSIIDKFPTNADQYLQVANDEWTNAKIKGREKDSLGTPEVVYKGEKVKWTQGTEEEIYNSIVNEMARIDKESK